MTTSSSWADQVLAYALAAWAVMQSSSSALMGFLGLLLIVAKLVQEVPKAWRTVYPKKSTYEVNILQVNKNKE